jgi:hypothetical protein
MDECLKRFEFSIKIRKKCSFRKIKEQFTHKNTVIGVINITHIKHILAGKGSFLMEKK